MVSKAALALKIEDDHSPSMETIRISLLAK